MVIIITRKEFFFYTLGFCHFLSVPVFKCFYVFTVAVFDWCQSEEEWCSVFEVLQKMPTSQSTTGIDIVHHPPKPSFGFHQIYAKPICKQTCQIEEIGYIWIGKRIRHVTVWYRDLRRQMDEQFDERKSQYTCFAHRYTHLPSVFCDSLWSTATNQTSFIWTASQLSVSGEALRRRVFVWRLKLSQLSPPIHQRDYD